MIGRLFEKFRTSIITRQLDKLPAIQHGREAINLYWTNNQELTKDFSDDLVNNYGGPQKTNNVLSSKSTPN